MMAPTFLPQALCPGPARWGDAHHPGVQWCLGREISLNSGELRLQDRAGTAQLDELLNFPFLEPSITVLERCNAVSPYTLSAHKPNISLCAGASKPPTLNP